MDRTMTEGLDRYLTGNYGEDELERETMQRYAIGTPQECRDEQGRGFYYGVDEAKRFASGRTVKSAMRNFERLYPTWPAPSSIWDSKAEQWIERE